MNFGQLSIKPDPCLCLMSAENLDVTIEGIFTKDRKSEVTQRLSAVISNTICWQVGHEVNIIIDGSNKIKVFGLGQSDNTLQDQIRGVLSEYDWDYLQELMTVNILIRYQN